MKQTLLLAAVGAAVLTATVLAAACGRTTAAAENAGSSTQAVERGKYLVSIMGCHDCHTPFKLGPNGPEPDMARALSGHPEQVGALQPAAVGGTWGWAGAPTNTAFSGPWGISYTANLTPDQNTGLGIWTEDMFMRAIRLGKHMGTSRPIMPPMPWPMYRNATDQDLRAIFAYLRTLEPITNHVPDYQPPAEDGAAAD